MKQKLLLLTAALLIAALFAGCALLPPNLFSPTEPSEPTRETVTVDADYLAKLEEVVGLLDAV